MPGRPGGEKIACSKNAPSDAAVSAYRDHRDAIYESLTPSKTKPLSPDALLNDVSLSWKTLKDVAHLDAFYVTRLARAATPMEFDGNNLTYFDNIYTQRLFNNDPAAGLNRNGVVVSKDLAPGTDYGYFVEITDSNVGGEANICIFQPHQFFRTP
jgi:hypothetical protein